MANRDLAIGMVALDMPSTIVYGRKTVTTSGTEVALAASTPLKHGVTVKALLANTNNVYVGLNGVTTLTGFQLDAGQEIFLKVDNLATVFIDADTNGEGVSFVGS